jgi:hypothetical protein
MIKAWMVFLSFFSASNRRSVGGLALAVFEDLAYIHSYLLLNFLLHVWVALDNWKSLIIQAWSPWIVLCMFNKHSHKQLLFEFNTLVSIAMEILRIWNSFHPIPLTLCFLAELSFHAKNRFQSFKLTTKHVEWNLKMVVYKS